MGRASHRCGVARVCSLRFASARTLHQRHSPQLVTSTTRARGTQTATAHHRPVDSQENASERSPFAEAQLAKVRRSAQEVLQSLLETQSRLESRGVDQWAADDFLAASAVAVEGDALYRAQDF
jgi:hypothetical protein